MNARSHIFVSASGFDSLGADVHARVRLEKLIGRRTGNALSDCEVAYVTFAGKNLPEHNGGMRTPRSHTCSRIARLYGSSATNLGALRLPPRQGTSLPDTTSSYSAAGAFGRH